MPVTLAEAKLNAQEDYDPFVIDEFRKESALLDALVFDQAVNPAGGGATLTYGYRRLLTQPSAAVRPLNTEYTAQNVTTKAFSTSLAVMGGAFEIDRVLARVGPSASGAIELNIRQKVKAARTKFQELVINGDSDEDEGFDGLDKALTESSTEIGADTWIDWSTLSTQEARLGALDVLDEFFGELDGPPTLVIGNKKIMAKIRSIVRGTGMYVRDPVEGLVGQDGRPVYRESYGGITFIDAGEKAGTNNWIIPIVDETFGAGEGATEVTGLTSLYAVRIGLDGFHGVTTTDSQLVTTILPDFTTANAVKKGEVELGPVGVALKATKAAAVLRNIKVAA